MVLTELRHGFVLAINLWCLSYFICKIGIRALHRCVMPGLISIIIIIDGKLMLVTDFTPHVNTRESLYLLYIESFFEESVKKNQKINDDNSQK